VIVLSYERETEKSFFEYFAETLFTFTQSGFGFLLLGQILHAPITREALPDASRAMYARS
jgi:hypothetical protein